MMMMYLWSCCCHANRTYTLDGLDYWLLQPGAQHLRRWGRTDRVQVVADRLRLGPERRCRRRVLVEEPALGDPAA